MPDVELTEVKRLRLEPGDVIVCRLSQRVRAEHMDHIRGLLKGRFPGHEVVVLEEGVSLEVFTPEGERRGA